MNLLHLDLFTLFVTNLVFIHSQTTYNFVNTQNYEIDLAYKYILGTNMYFFSNQNTSLFIITVDPDQSLRMSMKLYTNDTNLFKALKSSASIYFGIDFMIENTDITTSGYDSDIVLCKFNMQKVQCYDYAYQWNESVYVDNSNTKILKNNLIPIGFNNTQKTILEKNVLFFKSYYSISFEKLYPENFDNNTMFKYFYSNADKTNASITTFYGIEDYPKSNFSLSETYFHGVEPLKDGQGLTNFSYFRHLKIMTLFFIFIIYF
jgi:hypothetical protein